MVVRYSIMGYDSVWVRTNTTLSEVCNDLVNNRSAFKECDNCFPSFNFIQEFLNIDEYMSAIKEEEEI